MNGILYSRYTAFDSEYKEFMRKILSNIEPRFEKKGTLLLQECDEVLELIFIVYLSLLLIFV